MITDIDGSIDEGYAVAVAGGKIYVAGKAYVSASGNYDFAAVRYNSDGSLDDTFDSDGIVTTDFGTGADTPRGIVLDIECESRTGGIPPMPYRRQLDIDAAVSGYSMKLTFDDTTTPTAADIFSKCLASGDDFSPRLVRWMSVDRPRRELESFTSSNITVWFRIQELAGWAGGSQRLLPLLREHDAGFGQGKQIRYLRPLGRFRRLDELDALHRGGRPRTRDIHNEGTYFR